MRLLHDLAKTQTNPCHPLKERGRVKAGMAGFLPVSGRVAGTPRPAHGHLWALVPCFPDSCPSWVSGRAGQGPGAQPWPRGGAAGVLEASGRDPIIGARGTEGYGCVRVRAPSAVVNLGRSAWLRSSLRGGPRRAAAGHGAGPRGQRDQSGGRPRRPGAGARHGGDHALPAAGPAHAASRSGARAARDLTCPSRIA